MDNDPRSRVDDRRMKDVLERPWADNWSEIRRLIDEKAALCHHVDEVPLRNELHQQDGLGLVHSTRASNPEGLLEKELRARERLDGPAGRKYKKRHRNELTSTEITNIVHCYLFEHLTQAEVARKFRISPPLVSQLVTDARRKPEKLREKKAREKKRLVAF